MNNEELTADLYEQWIRHPITAMALNNIRKHRANIVSVISARACDAAIDDSHIRHQAVNLRNTDAILSMLTDFQLFINQTKK